MSGCVDTKLLDVQGRDVKYTDRAVQCLVGTTLRARGGKIAGRVTKAWVEDDGREVWVRATEMRGLDDTAPLAFSTPTQRAVRRHGGSP